MGIQIRVAHYPPYTSSLHVEVEPDRAPDCFRILRHAMPGVVFKSYKLVKELIENTNTQIGLTVTANRPKAFEI
ncbi:MAG: hypothetical protein GXP08_03985 [Gammaproteobacteria bacterium]|nr:hypothetical protein [Gammaproteobacteria bacterium]